MRYEFGLFEKQQQEKDQEDFYFQEAGVGIFLLLFLLSITNNYGHFKYSKHKMDLKYREDKIDRLRNSGLK